MMLNHRFLLTWGLVILSVAVLFGSASAQSSTRSSAATKYHRPIQARHGLYNRYTAPVSSTDSAPGLLPTKRRLS